MAKLQNMFRAYCLGGIAAALVGGLLNHLQGKPMVDHVDSCQFVFYVSILLIINTWRKF